MLATLVTLVLFLLPAGQASGTPGDALPPRAPADDVHGLGERVSALEAAQRTHTALEVQVLALLEDVSADMDVVRDEVQRSWIAELWWAFVSDHVTRWLNRFFGLEGGQASTPIWVAGVLSLILFALKMLVALSKDDGKLAKWLGPFVTWLTVVYLALLTGSLLLLAANAPGSDLETFRRQVEATDGLTEALARTAERVEATGAKVEEAGARAEALRAYLGERPTADDAGSGAGAQIAALRADRTAELESLAKGIDGVRGRLSELEASQPGGLWRTLVGLAALTVIGVAAYAGWRGLRSA